MATKKPSAAQLAARAAFTKMVKERARLRAAGKLPPVQRKTKVPKKRKIAAPPSPAQLAARKKFVVMIRAKAAAKKKNPRRGQVRQMHTATIKRGSTSGEEKFFRRESKREVRLSKHSHALDRHMGWGGSGHTPVRKKGPGRLPNPGVIKMSEAEFAKLGKKIGLGSVSSPVRTRSVSAVPRRKAQKKFKRPGIFGGSGFLGLGKSIQKISRNPKGEHLPGLAPKYQRMYEDILASSGSKRIAAATTMKAVKNPGLFGTIRSLIGIGGKKRKTAKVGYRKTQRGKYRPTTYMEKASLSHGRPQLHFATNPRRKPGHVQTSYGKGRKAYKRAKARGVTDYFPRMDKAILRGAAVSRGHARSHLPNPPVSKVFTEFRGREIRKRTPNIRAANGTPSILAALGKLKELRLRGKTLRFRAGHLAADGRKRLHIVGVRAKYKGNPNAEMDMGEVISVVYQADKPLVQIDSGDSPTKQFNYEHHFGEEGGVRPHLIVDPEGYMKIEGGSYGITSDGIID